MIAHVYAACSFARGVAADQAARKREDSVCDIDRAASAERIIGHHGVLVYRLVANDRTAGHQERARLNIHAAAERCDRAEAVFADAIAGDAAALHANRAALYLHAAAVLIRPAALEDTAVYRDLSSGNGIGIGNGGIMRRRRITVKERQISADDEDAAVPTLLRITSVHDMPVQVQRDGDAAGHGQRVRPVGIFRRDVCGQRILAACLQSRVEVRPCTDLDRIRLLPLRVQRQGFARLQGECVILAVRIAVAVRVRVPAGEVVIRIGERICDLRRCISADEALQHKVLVAVCVQMHLSGEILEHRIRKPFVPCVGAEPDAVTERFQLLRGQRGNGRHNGGARIADRGGRRRVEAVAVFDIGLYGGVVRTYADDAAIVSAAAGNRADGKAGLYGAVAILPDDAACKRVAGDRADVQAVFNGSVGGIADNSAGRSIFAGDRAGIKAVLDRYA